MHHTNFFSLRYQLTRFFISITAFHCISPSSLLHRSRKWTYSLARPSFTCITNLHEDIPYHHPLHCTIPIPIPYNSRTRPYPSIQPIRPHNPNMTPSRFINMPLLQRQPCTSVKHFLRNTYFILQVLFHFITPFFLQISIKKYTFISFAFLLLALSLLSNTTNRTLFIVVLFVSLYNTICSV